jgi:hypothetical protein
MKKFLAAFLLITIISVTACVDKTPLSEATKIYAGKWVANDGTWLQIYNDGGGSLESSNTKVSGGSTTITDTTLQIGLMGIGATYHIDKAPFEENGIWKMQLEGNVYIRR